MTTAKQKVYRQGVQASDLFFQASWGEGEVKPTTEVAERLGVSVNEAYRLLSGFADQGHIDRYGYRVKAGVWEDWSSDRAPKKKSLWWQRPTA